MVRVRFAPSPTGALHIGGVRTALYNYFFARHHGGTMLLRIEDTDSKRFVPQAEQYILEALSWLGIEIDEGVGAGGSLGPYHQSQRRAIYQKYVTQLLESGKAYRAYDTPEELDAQRASVPNFQYDASTRLQMRNSLTLSAQEEAQLQANGVPYVVRFKVEPGIEVTVNDLVRGAVTINSSILDDKVLYKSSDQLPTYHLANIVDDHLMEITHVIRGEEWLPSAPFHQLLYQALGWEETMPRFAHLSLLLKPEGNGKLSKRDGDRLGFPVFPLEWNPSNGESPWLGFRESGYLPEAVVSFLALLGWHPGGEENEVMSREQLIANFSLEKCSKSGARFDIEKARWFNHYYLQQKTSQELVPLLREQLAEATESFADEHLARVIAVVQDRLTLTTDLAEQTEFFFVAPSSYDPKTVKKRWKNQSPQELQQLAQNLIPNITPFTAAQIEQALSDYIAQNNLSMGATMNCLRLALVGKPKGPHLHEIIALLGAQETIARIERAVSQIPVNH